MHVTGRDLLLKFIAAHADARAALSAWLYEAEEAHWSDLHELKARYPSASVLPKNVVIFNVKGNKYRMEAKINFAGGVLMITWLGTHAEYSKRR